MKKPASILARLWSRVDFQPDKVGACWLWTGPTNGRYGKISAGGRGGKLLSVHRVAWEAMFRSEVPEGMQVCHTCDVPLCVNPDHLFIGTMADNNADKVAKGRQRCGDHHGENNPCAHLNWLQVRVIRRLAGHLSQDKIATYFNVWQSSVSRAILRKTWI